MARFSFLTLALLDMRMVHAVNKGVDVASDAEVPYPVGYLNYFASVKTFKWENLSVSRLKKKLS